MVANAVKRIMGIVARLNGILGIQDAVQAWVAFLANFAVCAWTFVLGCFSIDAIYE